MTGDQLRAAIVIALSWAATAAGGAERIEDPRNIRNGRVIPDEGYCDQPYVVITDDGHWLCLMTTGQGVEGQSGQHIVAVRSRDQGRTWSPAIAIEPADGPEASWVMPCKVPGGRIYAFYTYNTTNLRQVPGSNHPQIARRVDTLGDYVFKYSDDHGLSWSDRHVIPVREMRIDRENPSGGAIRLFWGVGKPILDGGTMFLGFAKVGKWGTPGTMVTSQGCFLRSDNLATERDPRAIRWETLPAGDEGLRAPKGPVCDEANVVALSDGSLYATCRTIDGYNVHSYSRDRGRTWTPPEYATYSPGGRRIKHPRAANFVRKLADGTYLLWFHHHGGEPVHAAAWNPYLGRNPAWISSGVENNGFLHWSEPEILLYDDDPTTRISYPDFIEDGGQLFVTETQKSVARVHEVDPTLLEDLRSQHARRSRTRSGLAVERVAQADRDLRGANASIPPLPDLRSGRGFTLEFRVWFDELTHGQILLEARSRDGKGLQLATTDRATLRLILSDGAHEASWDCDPGTHPGTLKVGRWQTITAIVDGGPKLIMFVIDGVLNDGGALREYGWGRFPASLGDVNGLSDMTLAPSLLGRLRSFRVYDRALRVSEAVGNFRADEL